jgi:hypothetical protein
MILTRKTVQFGFAAASAMLTVALAYLIVVPLPELDPPSFQLKPKARPISGAVAVVTPPAEAFIEIATRPPFLPSRKGLVATASGDVPAAPPDVALVGIILDKDSSLALLKTAAVPLATAYRVGGSISGWQVTEISPDRVILSAGAARTELRLSDNKATAHQAAAPAPISQ